MYVFNNGQPQRMRTQKAFREDAWGQSESGLIFPMAKEEAKQEEKPQVEYRENGSGIFVPVAPKPVKPTCISLFTGAGGFDLGFHKAGFRILAANDFTTDCCMTYCYNLAARPIQMHFITEQDRERFIKNVVKRSQRKPEEGAHWELVEMDDRDRAIFHRKGWEAPLDGTPHYFLGDVRKLTGAMLLEAMELEIGEVDAVCGGPPCQGFSLAGRRDVMDPRNSLVFEFARLILEIVPKMFVFENVPAIASMITPEGIPVVDAFCHMLEKGGYASYEGLKQVLGQMSDAWGVLKDQGRGRKNASSEGDEIPEQMSLF